MPHARSFIGTANLPDLACNPFTPTVQIAGLDGFLVSFGQRFDERANRAALAFGSFVEDAAWPEVQETSTSLVSTYVRFDPLVCDHDALRKRLTDLLGEKNWLKSELPKGRKLWTIPTVFEGTALKEAAALAGLSVGEAIKSLSQARLRVQTIGFAPGMPYLGQLPQAWDIPRQTTLNDALPAGALCVAIRQLVLFPVSTPTGWRHVGQTAIRLFDQDDETPFLLSPGDEATFQSVETLKEFENDRLGGATWEPIT